MMEVLLERMAEKVVAAHAEDEDRLRVFAAYQDGAAPRWLAILAMSVFDCTTAAEDKNAYACITPWDIHAPAHEDVAVASCDLRSRITDERRIWALLNAAMDTASHGADAMPPAAERIELAKAAVADITAAFRADTTLERMAEKVVEAHAWDEDRLRRFAAYRDGEAPRWLAILAMSMFECWTCDENQNVFMVSMELGASVPDDQQLYELLNAAMDGTSTRWVDDMPPAAERIEPAKAAMADILTAFRKQKRLRGIKWLNEN